MKKLIWALIMTLSLLITIGAGLFLYNQLNSHETEVPLNELPAEQQPAANAPAPAASTETVTAPAPAVPKEAAVPESKEGKAAKRHQGKTTDAEKGVRHIAFTYRSRAAKVYIMGDFNHWVRQPMKKSGQKVWTITLKLKPGTYQYQYVVNGKKTRDPNNTHFTKDGKSIIKIEPPGDDS